MKLRRRREEKEGAGPPSRAPPSLSQAAAPLPLPALVFITSILPPPPSPTSPLLHHSQFLLRHGSGEQYSPAIPPPAVPPLPFFFIKLPKQKSVAVVTWRSTLPADPAVTGRAQLAHPCSFIQSDGRGFSLRFQWRPLCGGWSHRKTKYENELSCFITFIDE